MTEMAGPAGVAWAAAPGGLRLRVRLTPKSARDALEGCAVLSDASVVMRARVRALPEDGKANTALVRLLAKTLGIAASTILIEAGASGRTKTLFIAGDAERLARLLASAAGH